MAGNRLGGLQAAGVTFPAVPQARTGSHFTLPAEPSAFLWNVPMIVLCLLVLNHFGRPFEFFFTGYKVPFVICVLGVLVVLVTRGLKMLNSIPGRPLVALVCWMLICTPLSTWRGGSTTYVLYYVGLEVVLFMLAASAPRSLADIRKIGYVIVGGYILYTLLGTVNRPDARFDLKGTFGNSDDLSLLIGFALPFVVLFALRIRSLPLRILALTVGGGLLVRSILLTGTRSALIALIAILIVYFLRATGAQRAALAVFALVGGLAMIAILPGEILTRFGTFTKVFNSETVIEESSSDEAMASVAERKDLLLDALRMVWSHPLFGVGPGEFMDYRAQFLDSASGEHKRFFPAHNSYLEVAAEDGLPGFFCYVGFLGAVYWTIRRSIRLNRPGSHSDWKAGYQIGTALEASFIFFVVCAAFMNCERYPHQYVLGGMAVALYRISAFRIAQNKGLQKEPFPAAAGGGFPQARRRSRP